MWVYWGCSDMRSEWYAGWSEYSRGSRLYMKSQDRCEECSLRGQCGIERNRLNILGKDSLDQDLRQDYREWN